MPAAFAPKIRNILNQTDCLILTSCVSSISHTVELPYYHEGNCLFVLLEKESISAWQTTFNPYVYVLIKANHGKLLRCRGLVRIINNQEKSEIINKWQEIGSSIPTECNIQTRNLYKIVPLEIAIENDASDAESVSYNYPENLPNLIQRFFHGLYVKIRLWLGIVRAPFFSASVGSVILGAAVAFHESQEISWRLFLLTLLGAVLAHAAANVINDYYDHRSGNDEANPFHNAFTGGSRMIQNKLVTPGRIFLIAVGLFLGAIVIGLYLNSMVAGNVILLIGLFGILLAFTYSATPLKLSYRGIGECAIVIAYGPLIVMGTYYVQLQRLDILPLLASIPTGILVGLILFINEFQDFQADAAVGKNTVVVKLRQKQHSFVLYKISLIFVYCWVVLFVLITIFPLWVLMVLITLLMLLKAFKIASENYDKIFELLPVNALTIGLHIVFTLLLSIAFIIDVFV